MAVWRSEHKAPAVDFEIEGRSIRALVWFASGRLIHLRSAVVPGPGSTVSLNWNVPGRIRADARLISHSAVAPDGTFRVSFELIRLVSSEGVDALKSFAKGPLGMSELPKAVRAGSLWSYKFAAMPEVEPALASEIESVEELRGAEALAAGPPSSDPDAPPLEIGREATTVAVLGQWFRAKEGTSLAVYLNLPCAYVVAGRQYWGRALRLNERWLNVNTSSTLPGLGVRLRCDLTLDLDGVERVVSIRGSMGRKLDPPAGSTYTGAMAIRISAIDEGSSPGLLIHFLERQERERQDAEP
jgi:hypothetical protein